MIEPLSIQLIASFLEREKGITSIRFLSNSKLSISHIQSSSISIYNISNSNENQFMSNNNGNDCKNGDEKGNDNRNKKRSTDMHVLSDSTKSNFIETRNNSIITRLVSGYLLPIHDLYLLPIHDLDINNENQTEDISISNDSSKSSQQEKEMAESKASRAHEECMELVAGDDKGNLLLILEGKKVFYIKQLFGNTISYIEYQLDRFGYPFIIAADESGVIACFNAFFDVNWRLNLPRAKEPSPIKSILCERFYDNDTNEWNDLVLAVYDRPAVYFIKNGELFRSLETQSVITCMASGRITQQSLNVEGSLHKQIILGSVNGTLYLLENFSITQFIHVGYHVETIQTMERFIEQNQPDYILCGGAFCALRIYLESDLIAVFETNDWVFEIAVSSSKIAIATFEPRISVLKISDLSEKIK